MRLSSKIFATLVLASAVSLGACGGSSDGPPAPLSKRFDDMYIAQIPLDQKQAVVQTQNDWSVAKMENAKAEADFNELSGQINIVRNDHKAARLQLESAQATKKSAEASADTNRINTAQVDVRNAELAVKAAESRIKYYETYRGFLKTFWYYTQANMYWREAQYELAKSQLGEKNNIAPKNVTYTAFPSQEAERNKQAQSLRSRAESEKSKATSARDNWMKAQSQADSSSGRASQFPDPMLPRPQSTTAPGLKSTL